jgi:gelsolin
LAKIYLIKEGDYEEIMQPVFSTGDTYVVDAGDRIWIWLGEKTTVDEKFAGAFISDLIDKQRKGKPRVETVHQGSEPLEFRKTVGPMRIVDQDLAKSILKKTEKKTHPVVMYRISGEEFETLDDIKFVQVPLSKASLDSEDVFLIDTYDTVYIWQGKKSSVREKVVGGRIARKFDAERVGVQKEVFVEEGEEPDKLKKILGL